MTIIKCDKCGKRANEPYYDAGACETFNNSPYEIIFREGTTYTGEQLCYDKKVSHWVVCEDCFNKAKKAFREAF